jgi:hypothetical protein
MNHRASEAQRLYKVRVSMNCFSLDLTPSLRLGASVVSSRRGE